MRKEMAAMAASLLGAISGIRLSGKQAFVGGFARRFVTRNISDRLRPVAGYKQVGEQKQQGDYGRTA